MPAMNRVFLMGNLTRDPALNQLPGGASKASLGLAINETHRGRNGETKQTVCFVDVEAWEKQAQVCADYLTKGAPVAVEGRLHFDSWTGKDGQKRSKLYVRADRIHLIGRAAAAEGAAEGVPEAEPALEDPDSGPAPAAAPPAPARPAPGPRPVARPRAA